jgi:hypothetical protein
MAATIVGAIDQQTADALFAHDAGEVAFGATFRGAFGEVAGFAKKRLKQPNRSSSSFRNLQSATAFATAGFGFGFGAMMPS